MMMLTTIDDDNDDDEDVLVVVNGDIVCWASSLIAPGRSSRRKQSSVGLGLNYPGDLLSQARPRRAVPPILKRNTIADFANTRAYQASTASLISASDQGIQSLCC